MPSPRAAAGRGPGAAGCVPGGGGAGPGTAPQDGVRVAGEIPGRRAGSPRLEPLQVRRLGNLIAGTNRGSWLGVAVMVYALTRRNGVQTRWATAATLPLLLDGVEIEDEP